MNLSTVGDVVSVTGTFVGNVTDGTAVVSATTASLSQYQTRGGSPLQRKVSVTKVFTLCAAHSLPHHKGRCYHVHGHNYKVEVTLEGPIINYQGPGQGMVVDFDIIAKDFHDLIYSRYDHKNLNLFYDNPTAENLAWDWLSTLLTRDPRYKQVKVWETDECSATVSI